MGDYHLSMVKVVCIAFEVILTYTVLFDLKLMCFRGTYVQKGSVLKRLFYYSS